MKKSQPTTFIFMGKGDIEMPENKAIIRIVKGYNFGLLLTTYYLLFTTYYLLLTTYYLLLTTHYLLLRYNFGCMGVWDHSADVAADSGVISVQGAWRLRPDGNTGTYYPLPTTQYLPDENTGTHYPLPTTHY
jgi:hypothetical protein